MGHAIDISRILRNLQPYQHATVLSELAPVLAGNLPKSTRFDDDIWNILDWVPRKGNARVFNVDFGCLRNEELKALTKVFILHKRQTERIGCRAVYNYVYAIKFMDEVMWGNDNRTFVNADFENAEEYMVKNTGSAPRLCGFLAEFGEWLNLSIGLAISYTPTIKTEWKHGRKGTEEGREEKLLPDQVIRDMLAANNRTDLSEKDRFFLAAMTILIATGFRINELATLPKACWLEDADGCGIKFFVEKKGQLEKRFFHPDMVPSVRTALEYITQVTEPGREIVRQLRQSPGWDWFSILKDQMAIDYFVGKFAHEWTSNPLHQMINPDGAWFDKERRFVDVMGILESEGSVSAAARKLGVDRNQYYGLLAAQQNAREGKLPNNINGRGKVPRTSWDTDSRVISLGKFMEHCGIHIKTHKRETWRYIIEEAQALQLSGEVYPCPPFDAAMEKKYLRHIRAVVHDKRGRSMLETEDALFVIPRYLFSEARGTKHDDYRLVTDRAMTNWLSGIKRSYGTENHEDSCFSRLGIVDPRTGEIAKFTSHDVRHWLDTTYAEGHMDEDTIAIVFGRKKSSNHIYDQTSKKKRLENLRAAVREGKSFGHISANYNRLASISRERAEQYLRACTRMVNIMPHGACMLDWAMKSCKNCLSCFAGGDGPCSYLTINMADKAQYDEVARLNREIGAALEYMEVWESIGRESPQRGHFRRIKRNLESLLRGRERDAA